MNKNTSKLYIIAGAILILIAVSLLAISSYYVYFVLVALFFAGISLICSGYINYKSSSYIERDNVDRDGMMAKSLLPGYIQIRTLKINKGVLQLFIFMSGLMIIAFGMIIIMTHSIEEMQTGLLVFLIGLTILCFSILWSALEINEYCNKMGLPYSGGVFEIKIKDNILAIKLLFCATILLMVLFLALLFIYS